MTLAIEPMVNAGRPGVKILNDGWTVVTQDGSLSAHFEHTVLITEGEPEILTWPEKDAFEVEGVVVEVLPNRTYRVELANGHRLLAFVAGKARQSFAGLAPGDKVRLQLSPYDLSEGRIVVETKNDLNMKVRASVKKLCENCKIVRRKGVIRVICTQQAPQAAAGLSRCNPNDLTNYGTYHWC